MGKVIKIICDYFIQIICVFCNGPLQLLLLFHRHFYQRELSGQEM